MEIAGTVRMGRLAMQIPVLSDCSAFMCRAGVTRNKDLQVRIRGSKFCVSFTKIFILNWG